MVVHLGVQRPLGQRPLQLVDQAVPAEGGLRITAGQELVQQLVRDDRGFASCHARVPSFPSSWPAHGIPDSPWFTGHQQLSLLHAHCGERGFLPIQVYDTATGRPVAIILRPGKTPDGAEVALVLRHLMRAIRGRWPKVEILIRGDSHYSQPEALTWLERNRVGYVFGLAGNKILLGKVRHFAEDAAVARVEDEGSKARRYAEFRYAAKTWPVERQVIARIEASTQGTDSRFVVTNLPGAPRWLYENVYCAHGQAENFIKAHKLHLASDRTSCNRATANQFRLLIHTAAYWLLHTLRGLAPARSFWRDAQFDTLRLALIKVAARVTEMATRIKVALPSCYPYQDSLTLLSARAAKLPP